MTPNDGSQRRGHAADDDRKIKPAWKFIRISG